MKLISTVLFLGTVLSTFAAATPNPSDVDTSFAAPPNFGVNGTTMLFVDAADRIFGHSLTPVDLLSRLNPDGSRDLQFQFTNLFGAFGLDHGGEVFSLLKTADPNSQIVRVRTDGTIDPAFAVPPIMWPWQSASSVNLVARQLNGSLLLAASAGSDFNLRSIHPDGTLDFDFPRGSPGNVMVPGILLIPPDGRIVIWVAPSNVIGPMGNRLLILNPNGTFATTNKIFAYSTAIQPDGKILFGAGDGSVSRLNLDYQIDPSFVLTTDGSVSALDVQPNGKILVGGTFAAVNGVPRKNLARANSDGSLDLSFDPGSGFRNDVPGNPPPKVGAIALQSTGKILVAGNFTSLNGISCTNLVRLFGGDPPGPPQIQVQPQDHAIEIGAAASLTALVSGSPGPYYLWQFNGAGIPSATNNTFILPSFQAGDAGEYLLIASNSFGMSTSRVAHLTVAQSKPLVVQPLVSQRIAEGSSVSFSVTASSSTPLTYRWRQNNYDISDASNSKFVINSAAVSDAGIYQVIISNAAGAITNQAVLTVTASPMPATADPLDTWTPIYSANRAAMVPLHAGIFTNGIYLVVGEKGTILRSTNGIDWEKEDSKSSTAILKDISFANGAFVAVGNNNGTAVVDEAVVLTSSDGISWIKSYQWFADLNVGYFSMDGVSFAQGSFLAYGNDRGRFSRWITSTDGASWTMVDTHLHYSNSSSGPVIRKLLYTGATFEAFVLNGVGVVSDLYTSTDLANWAAYSFTPAQIDVAYGSGIFSFVGQKSGVSTNGTNVTSYSTSSPSLQHITFGKGLFLGCGDNGALATSTGGLNWKSRNSGSASTLNNAFWGANNIFVIGNSGTLLMSGNLSRAWLSELKFLGGHFQFTATGDTGEVYSVQKSVSLGAGWQDLGSLTNAAGSIRFSDPMATNSHSFYRLLVR